MKKPIFNQIDRAIMRGGTRIGDIMLFNLAKMVFCKALVKAFENSWVFKLMFKIIKNENE